ncbi:RidA family protein [Sciscionella marina]|uniref:RidA family protein n=1 Tax=Sciscionella marina TaxID=508770 RepID=UPI0003779B8B|nr:RidA family protein [Sciscionella marina]
MTGNHSRAMASAPARPSEQLTSLGLALPPIAAPSGFYAAAVRHADLIYTSGQLPVRAGLLAATGLVGAAITVDEASKLAELCTLNALAAAADLAGGIDRLDRIVKVAGFVASAEGFIEHALVINGASDLLLRVFGDRGRHARSALGVKSLPLGAPVEVELIIASEED